MNTLILSVDIFPITVNITLYSTGQRDLISSSKLSQLRFDIPSYLFCLSIDGCEREHSSVQSLFSCVISCNSQSWRKVDELKIVDTMADGERVLTADSNDATISSSRGLSEGAKS